MINVLSLFDGMSCCQIALKEMGIDYNYYASEIDKFAIKTTLHNFPNTIQLGDIRNIDLKSLPKIDLLVGGSPCQGFSIAGKQLNFNDERSKLFFEYVRILREIKPRYFLLENVVMKKEYQDVISKELGIEPIMINSALVSAQSRKRLYWTNIKEGQLNFFENISLIPQPKDRGILLKDILENGFVDRIKSHCLTATYSQAGNLKSYFNFNERQLVFNSPILVGQAVDIKGKDQLKRIYSIECKSPTLTTMQGGYQEPKIAASRGRYLLDGKTQDYKMSTQGLTTQYLEIRNDNKSNTLTTVQKDNLLLLDKNSYRKLTVRECARLQTVPEWFEFPVSNSQAYKMLGNGFTVEVIKHILSFMECERWI